MSATSMETVSIHAEVEGADQINGRLPLVAGFDLAGPLTEEQFAAVLSDIEEKFNREK
jgi:hypothetical protein